MKKYLLLIAAVFSFTFAQAQGFKFGAKGGLNYSNVVGDDFSDDVDYKYGYHFGVVGLYEIDDMFGIKPEILYTTKGYQFNMGSGEDEIEMKTSLNYFTLPILLNVKAGGLFFELGPEIGYQAAVIQETKIGGEKTEDWIPKGNYAQFDMGYVAGIGYMLPMGLNFGIRYNGGFKSIFDTKNDEEPNVRNNNFMFSIGYMFGGGE